MKSRVLIALITLSLLCAWMGEGEAQVGRVKLNDPLASSHTAETTLEDQADVAVTVYNAGRALVRDRRKVALLPGEVELRFGDVAQQIQPETVSLRSLTEPGALQILEQNYEYDLMSPAKLMEKYVGRQVRLVSFDTRLGFTEREAEVLSVNEGNIFKVDNEIYLGHPGNVVLPEIPENLIARPSLVWMLHNAGTDHDIEVTYLTGGLSWRADYVLTLDESETKLDIEGWVTLDNQSGATYTNAKLKVVAGEVNVARPDVYDGDINGLTFAEQRVQIGAAMPAEEYFGEYHLYTLPRRTTIKQNQSKQVTLLTASEIAVDKVYEYRGTTAFYCQPMPPREDEEVSVFLRFQNEEANRLGVPLPAGIMRVYQRDSEGMLQFSGEDYIEHTPKDEEVRLRLGTAFDVVAERTQTDFQKAGEGILEKLRGRIFESAFEIKVRNHKENDITVDIIEPMVGDWKITEQSHEFVKKDARTAVFSVPVPKDGETVVTYRVRVAQ